MNLEGCGGKWLLPVQVSIPTVERRDSGHRRYRSKLEPGTPEYKSEPLPLHSTYSETVIAAFVRTPIPYLLLIVLRPLSSAERLQFVWPYTPIVLKRRVSLTCKQTFFFFPPDAMTTVIYHLARCIVLFTFIIKSICIMTLQLTHTYSALFQTKEGHLLRAPVLYVSLHGFAMLWSGNIIVPRSAGNVYDSHRNIEIFHMLFCCRLTWPLSRW